MKQTFYKRLKKLCSDTKLSVNQLERKLGYPRNALHNYKYGSEPSGKRLLELAQYFEVSPDFLLNGEQGKQVTMLFDQLNEEEKLEIYVISKEWVMEKK